MVHVSYRYLVCICGGAGCYDSAELVMLAFFFFSFFFNRENAVEAQLRRVSTRVRYRYSYSTGHNLAVGITDMHACCIVLAAYLELGGGGDDTQGCNDAWLCALEYSIVSYGILLNGRVDWGGMAGKDGGFLGWRFGMWW